MSLRWTAPILRVPAIRGALLLLGCIVLSLLSSEAGTISLQPNGRARRESVSLHRLLDMLEVGGSIPSPPTKLDLLVAYSTCIPI